MAAEEFAEALPSYPFLDDTDRDQIFGRVHARYAARYNELRDAYKTDALQRGLTPEKAAELAHRLADEAAMPVLSQETLRAVMQELNDRYAAKAKPRGKGADDDLDEDDDEETDDDDKAAELEADAAAHNRRTQQRLDQRRRTRTLRGAGGPPSSTPREPDLSNMSWDEKMAAMKRQLHGGK